ncbi:hypothetical protein B0H19DRAFT_1193643 [Mycena capillaripes]|nr:hypothetical protein B0H19DRAFT_1193643 [Mycena capillaripes]
MRCVYAFCFLLRQMLESLVNTRRQTERAGRRNRYGYGDGKRNVYGLITLRCSYTLCPFSDLFSPSLPVYRRQLMDALFSSQEIQEIPFSSRPRPR